MQRRRPRESIGELGTGGQRPPLLRRTQVKQAELQLAHIDAGGERGSRGGGHALVVDDSDRAATDGVVEDASQRAVRLSHTNADETHARFGNVKALKAVDRAVNAEARGGRNHLLDPRLMVRAALARVLGRRTDAAILGQRVGAKTQGAKVSRVTSTCNDFGELAEHEQIDTRASVPYAKLATQRQTRRVPVAHDCLQRIDDQAVVRIPGRGRDGAAGTRDCRRAIEIAQCLVLRILVELCRRQALLVHARARDEAQTVLDALLRVLPLERPVEAPPDDGAQIAKVVRPHDRLTSHFEWCDLGVLGGRLQQRVRVRLGAERREHHALGLGCIEREAERAERRLEHVGHLLQCRLVKRKQCTIISKE